MEARCSDFLKCYDYHSSSRNLTVHGQKNCLFSWYLGFSYGLNRNTKSNRKNLWLCGIIIISSQQTSEWCSMDPWLLGKNLSFLNSCDVHNATESKYPLYHVIMAHCSNLFECLTQSEECLLNWRVSLVGLTLKECDSQKGCARRGLVQEKY